MAQQWVAPWNSKTKQQKNTNHQFSPRSMYLYLTQATKESDSKKRTLKRVQKGYPDPLFFLDFGPVQKGYPDVLMSHINVL